MKYTFKNVMILGLGCLLGFTSCSDSWLNTDSTQTAGGDVIFSTTDNAKLVINGICRTMVQQHAYYGQNFNGEGTMKLLYGSYPGDVATVTESASRPRSNLSSFALSFDSSVFLVSFVSDLSD